MRLRFEPRIMGSRIRPFDTDRELLCAPTLLTLIWWGKWNGSKAGVTVLFLRAELYLALCSYGEPVVPKGKSRGKGCGFPFSTPLPTHYPAELAGGLRLCPRSVWLAAVSVEPVGPKRGRCSRTQDFIWPFIMAIFIWPFILLVASSLQWATDKHWPN